MDRKEGNGQTLEWILGIPDFLTKGEVPVLKSHSVWVSTPPDPKVYLQDPKVRTLSGLHHPLDSFLSALYLPLSESLYCSLVDLGRHGLREGIRKGNVLASRIRSVLSRSL